MAGVVLQAGGVVLPVRGALDQHRGGLVAVFGLAGDIADGLVQQDGDLLGLLLAGGGVHLDTGLGAHALAQHGQLAVHAHPAGGDPFIGLAP